MNRKEQKLSSVFLSVTAVFSLVLVLLASFALAPQAAPPTGAEPPPERLPRGTAVGWPESLPHLVADAGPSEVAPAQAPASVASGSKLVFQSLRDGNWEIYRADGDGSNQARLTSNSGTDIQPRLNRGCDRIAFAAYRGGNYDIYAMNVDGSSQTRLTGADEPDVNPAWSRDGTRIAFESYRSGQGEVYVMNANGTNQTRLTTDAAWDGEPAWSLDGSAIAFTSYRNSVYRIWRMNADGSGQVQLSSQAYSEHAAWSPDGSLIAYDADGNGDGWQELWVMNADGTNQHQVYDPPEADTDAWVGSWSPDGQYLAFTRISWVYYQGRWYWTTAYLDAWEMSTGLISRLSSNGEDWYPDWQTNDLWPPSSSVAPLPTHSPAPVPVSWSGTDVGPAGIASYDVQVREEPGGTWSNWLLGTGQTSASYPGLGGHTYAFRSRAWDYAGNAETWPTGPDASTTVEALPPRTAVSPLPPYVRGEVTVAWGGSDVGGSGIAAYDVQVRDGTGGAWTNWHMGTTATSAGFSGEAGHIYFFRSRGVDEAQNAEAWPAGDGDASTTFYLWAMTGTLRDNRGTPVTGGVVSLIPEALATIPSDVDGNYSAYEAVASSDYTATWSKAGYGGLPPTVFSGNADAQADMVLPPADNVVLNWGFESGSLEPGWLAEGVILPGITPDRPHTGSLSAAIGQGTGLFDPPVNLSNSTNDSARASVAVDGSGAVHVVWLDQGDGTDLGVFYARREAGGAWSAPESVSGSLYAAVEGDWYAPQLAVEVDGTAHVAWPCKVPGSEDIYYNRRSLGGTWSGPANVSQNGHTSRALDMVLGFDGALHLVWEDHTLDDDIMYARRAPEGAWSAVANLSQNIGFSDSPQVAAGPDGTVHAVWTDQTPGNRDVFYASRASGGTWSAPLNLSSTPGRSAHGGLAVAADGSVHVAWSDDTVGYPPAIYYALRSAGGIWSDPVQVADPALGGGSLTLAMGPDGSIHLVWGWGSVRYARRGAEGMWSPPEEGGSIGGCDTHELCVDSSGTAHTVCSGYLSAWDILQLRRTAGGVWSGWISISNSAEYSQDPHLTLDGDDGVHVVWMEGPQYYRWEILYSQSAGAEATGSSMLSQELTVPPEATAPTLSFWYRLEGTPAPGVSWFTVQVHEGGSSTTVLTASSTSDWTHRWVDLSPWAGQVVLLRFLVHQTEGQPSTGATLDEVSVGSAYPDLWVEKAASAPAVTPGEQVEFTLTYGNRGGAPASGVALTDTLPAGLLFVSADPSPSTVTPHLTWRVGDLLAASGPFEITLIASVEPSVPAWTTLNNVVVIGSLSLELETLNNEAGGSVWVGYRTWLPLILKSW